jgi:hypothetical protein
MSRRLQQYLFDTYTTNGYHYITKIKRDFPIQVDDQDDNDILTDFCNVFVTVGRKDHFEIEILGNMPITQEIEDFAEIYQGAVDREEGRITLCLNPNQVEALVDLATLIRKTSYLGESVGNTSWHKISARTISTLYRLARTVKEYNTAS